MQELYTAVYKIEANANPYTFVWGYAFKTNKEKKKLQLDALRKHVKSIAASELDNTDPSGFDKIGKEKIAAIIAKIDLALQDKPVGKQVKQKLNYAQKNWHVILDTG